MLHNKCIMELAKPIRPGWTSNIFLRKKKSGNHCVILNLKLLNAKIHCKRFKLPTIFMILHMIKQHNRLISLDLADAYSNLRFKNEHCSYLQFSFENRHFMYLVLLNGISSGPESFVATTRGIIRYLRKLGLLIAIYIDNCILVAPSSDQLTRQRDKAIHTFRNCGFTVNVQKSHLSPTTQLEFLGFIIDTVAFTITVTDRKWQELSTLINNLLAKRWKRLSVRKLARLIGRIVSFFPASSEAPVHYRVFERAKIRCLHTGSWSSQLTLGTSACTELLWWQSYLAKGPPQHSLHCRAPDSSLDGWGATINPTLTAQGSFTQKHDHLSINTKELMAVWYGLNSFKDVIKDKTVLCHSDNSTTVNSLKCKGSRNPFRDRLTVKIFNLIFSLNCTLLITFIKGSRNVSADALSREGIRREWIEWSISDECYNWVLCHLPFTPNIDFFTNYLNYKVDRYCSYKRDPKCFHVDSLTLNWSDWLGFAHPPYSLIDRCLTKLDQDGVRDIAMIVPAWPTSPFAATLQRHLKSAPIIISKQLSTLKLPWDAEKKHPIKNLRLVLTHLCASYYPPTKF